jgi:hypothetical protein
MQFRGLLRGRSRRLQGSQAMGQGIVRGRLRSRLLVGVATVALTIPASRWAQAQDAAKWSPYIELGGMGGNTHSWGDVDIFLPLWQDQTSLLFGDLRGTFTTQPSQEGNFGLGYRTQISPEWILGGYGYFDIQNSENDNLFYQITLGAELKSIDWDFRVNGYIPLNPDGGIVDSKTQANIRITGNLIQLNSSTQKEKALYGFDGEVGWRVPVFPADGDMDLRVYAGGYYFTNSDVDTIAGPRGRIEARLYDIDFLGMQSRLTAQGVVQWDQPRGTQGFGGLELRIPLGAITGAPGPKLNPLDRRMVDRVQRDVDIVSELGNKKKESEDVIVDELTVSTHTIVFANGPGGGSGVQGSPTGLQGAPGLAPGLNGNTGSNAIIVADGTAGNINITNPLQLLPGQALIGGGSVVKLTGVKTGLHVNFLFPGSRPTLVGNGSTKDLVHMASGSQNEVFGLNLTGAFLNGVYGANMERAIVKRSNIDFGVQPDQTDGNNGVLITERTDGPSSSFVHIAYNTVINAPDSAFEVENKFSGSVHLQTVVINQNTVSGGPGDDAIEVGNDLEFTGTVLSQKVSINDNTVASFAGEAIHVENNAISGAAISQVLTIDPNIILSIGGAGIRLENSLDSGGTLTQTALIVSNQISDGGESGIRVTNYAQSAGTALSQALTIENNTIASMAGNGIEVLTRVDDASGITQAIAIDANWISHVALNGIFFDAEVDAFGGLPGGTASLAQTFAIDNNVISDTGENGILDSARLFSIDGLPAALTQLGEINGNQVTSTGVEGIVVVTHASGGLVAGSNLDQAIDIDNNTVTHVNQLGLANEDVAGIHVENVIYGLSHATQSIVIDPNIVSDVTSGNGIEVFNSLSNSTLSQSLLIAGNTVSDVGRDGILVGNQVLARGFDDETTLLTQAATITGNQVTGSGETGIRIGTYVSAAQIPDPLLTAGVVQTLQVAGNTVVDSGSDGILVANNVFADGEGSTAFLSQAASIFANRVTGSGEDGIHVHNAVRADYYAGATLSQSVAINNNSVTDSGLDGVHVHTYVRAKYDATATVVQSVAVNNNTVTSSGIDGIFVATYASGYADGPNGTVRLTQTVVVDPNTVVDSTGDGIGVHSRLDYLGSSAVQSITIAANSVTGSGRDGVYVGTTLSAASMAQTVSVIGNSISDSGQTGIEVRNDIANYFGNGGTTTLSQHAVIDLNRISDSGENGILVDNNVFTDGEGGRVFLSQLAAIDGNVVSSSVDNGILVDTRIEATNYNDASATVSQSIAIDNNTVASSGVDGVQVSTSVFADGEGGHVFLSQLAAIDGNVISNSGENGVLVDSEIRAIRYATATVTQGIAIDDNTIANSGLDGILVSTFASALYSGSFGGNGRVILDQTQTIDPNIITNSGRDGIAVKTQLYYVFGAQQSVTIAANVISASGRDGVYVGTSLHRGSGLSQSLVIADNSITDSGSNGIQVANLAEDLGATLVQTAAIVGNSITSSGLNGIFVSNYIKGIGNNFINQSLAIGGNTIDGVLSAHVTAGTPSLATARDGGNGILVRNNIAAYQRLIQSLAVQGNVVTNVRSFDGIYVKTLADKNATATQTFTVAGNHAFNNGGYGVALKTVVSDHVGSQAAGASVSQSIAVTGNTLDNNLYGGVGVFVIASAGKVVQNGSIAGNVLTNAEAHFGEGIDALGLAGSSAVVSQSFAVNNNFITGNAVGVYLRAGDRIVLATASNPAQILTGGVVSQHWTFTSNSILSNNANFVSGGTSAAGHGLYGLVSGGTGTTQIIDLVSGNVISGNSGDGVRLFAFGNASQTATLHSNLGVDPHNTITFNGTDLSSNNGVNQSVTP